MIFNSDEIVHFLTAGSENFLTNFWIGLSDLRLSQTFEWVDGSEVLFTNWNDNEPNNFGTSGEDCVEIEGGVSAVYYGRMFILDEGAVCWKTM